MRVIIAIVSILFLTNLFSQEDHVFLGARIAQGSILLHSQELRAVKNSYPRGIEIEWGKHRTSQKVWNNCNCYPRTGFTFSFWDFDNPDVLGFGFTNMYFVEPVFGAKNKLSFSLRAAAGFSFQSMPYDMEQNPNNLSYSTYWGIPLQLGISLHYRIKQDLMLDFNGVLNHLSNGGLKEPNKGINWPAASIGISKYFSSPTFLNRERSDWKASTENFNRWDLSGYTTYYSPSPKKYLWSLGLEAKYARRISRLSNLTGGLDWIYDQGHANKSTNEREVDGTNLGVALGHEFVLGRFLFAQQFAVYLLKPQTQANDVYQRYTLMYRITNRLNGGIGLKSHGHVADFGDFRVGISF